MTRTVTVNFKGLTLVCTGEYQHDELICFDIECIKTEHGEDAWDFVNNAWVRFVKRDSKNARQIETHPYMEDLETVALDAIAAEDAEPKEEAK